ncbi:hypothetical protein [Streptomyces coelicoflavus]|uniref:Uncharacterized protein n=1 Tax=Streptomyces coelicoflavus TaxID=285562 RepID=A0A6N9URT1_9ACTN|nr:hypothetical protein [Streptomyces coelicoflavus]NEB19179.1 hypothetical protein [Streptomyces coelicoflavus]
MSPGNPPDLPPDPRTLVWYDRAALLTARSAATDVLAPRSMALRNLLWSWLATAVVAGGWCFAWVGLGWYLDLDDPEGADLLVTVVLVVVSLLVAGVAAAAFRRVVRRGRAAHRLLEAWTALDRLPPARALPPGNIPQPLASTWDLMRAGQPWKNTVPLDGRRYLAFLSGKSLMWMMAPVAPLLAGGILVLVALTGDLGQENGGTCAQVAVAGAGFAIAAVGLWGMAKGLRHYTWALREARARVSEEKTWPSLITR